METQFDRTYTEEEVDRLFSDIKQADRHPEDGTPLHQALAASLVHDADDPPSVIGYLTRSLEEYGDPGERARQIAAILRDIVGNPFRPTSIAPAWLTPTVLALAGGIYTDQAFDRLPILADALQDAGCEDAELLNHCRSGGPHVRGCWAVDLILGKE